MKQKAKKISIEKALRASSLAPLKETEILSAQKRVWNQIDSEVNDNSTNLSKPFTFTQNLYRFTFNKYSVSFVLLFTMLAGGAFGMNYYLQLNQTPEALVAEIPEKEIQNIDLQTLASERFKELNGFTFEEFKEAIKEEAPVQQNPSIDPAAPKPTNIIKLDEKKAEEILKKAENQTFKVYFSEKSLEIANIEEFKKLPFYNQSFTSLESLELIKFQNWNSLNYSKSIIFQDKEILEYELKSPQKSVLYQGGKYAIETQFENPSIQIGGLTTEGQITENPDLKILKSILENTETKIKEVKKEGNKELIAFETKVVNPDLSISSTVYFLNKKDLSIVREEHLIDNKLIYTLSTTTSTVKEVGEIDTEINANDLILKEILFEKLSLPSDPKTFIQSPITAEDYSKKYPIFVLEEKPKVEDMKKIELYDFSPEESQKYLEFYKKLESLEFNPNLKEENLFDTDREILLSTQLYPLAPSVKIYETSPKNLFSEDNDLRKVKIKLDNKQFDAMLHTDSKAKVQMLTFEYQKRFIVITEKIPEKEKPLVKDGMEIFVWKSDISQ